MELSDKTAIVFGCNGRIAQTICKKLYHDGYNLVVTDLKREQADATTSKMKNITAIGVDVRSENDIKEAVQIAIKKYNKINLVVNCSRIALFKEALELTEHEWDTIIDFNTKSMYYIAKAVLNTMIDNNTGIIIGMTSKTASSGPANLSAYSASMNASIGFLRSLSCEVRNNNIRVNALCPGYIEHEELVLGAELTQNEPPDEGIYIQFSPLINVANEPEALANMIAFLASKQGEFITGQAYSLWDDDMTYYRNLGQIAEF
jgi:NAD(P)-dependent dehydrogenase (short-subunit alcohol dehydrogenase family)